MFGKNKERGFTLLEFLFSAALLAVLTTAGLFAIRHQSKTALPQQKAGETDHIGYSILAVVSSEIRSAGSGSGNPPIYFVNGGKKISKNDKICDPSSAAAGGTDCVTFSSVSYDGTEVIKKSFFVEKGVLKMRNSDSSKTQSLTSTVKVEDFQISFLPGGGSIFTDSIPQNGEIEAVRVTITLRHGADTPQIKTYSAVVNPRNI